MLAGLVLGAVVQVDDGGCQFLAMMGCSFINSEEEAEMGPRTPIWLSLRTPKEMSTANSSSQIMPMNQRVPIHNLVLNFISSFALLPLWPRWHPWMVP